MPNRMNDPLRIVGVSIAPGTFSDPIRLPRGERYQVVHFSAGTIRYLYGSEPSPILYAPVTGVSQILVHPGEDTFIQLDQLHGTVAYIHVVGMVPTDPRSHGWTQR